MRVHYRGLVKEPGQVREVALLATCLSLVCCGPQNTASSGELSVLTYNVHGLPSSVTGDDTAGRMAQIAPLLGSFDVVGLQEDFVDSNAAILELAAVHSNRLRFADLLDSDRVYGSGLALWTNYELLEERAQHFGSCHGLLDGSADCFASKGFQATRQRLAPGVEVDFYNTHLEAGGGPEDQAARAQQVQMLVDALTGFSANHPVVFTGDFNLHSSDPEDSDQLARLRSEGGLTDSCEDTLCSEPDRIDRIFFRSSETLQLEALSWQQELAFFDPQGTALSDHDALSARLAWRFLAGR